MRIYQQRARTEEPGVPVLARGDDTSELELGTYSILELGPEATADGHWELVSVLCDGRPVASAQGRTSVRLTEDDPHQDCTFVDRFTRDPEPPNPTLPPTVRPTPTPEPRRPPTGRRPRRLRDVRRPQRRRCA